VKIAILGGTFDPVHNGHLTVARSVVQAFDIDELHFVPAFCPPHKHRSEVTSPFHRFAMVALATASDSCFRVSAIETDTLGPRYSVDTLGLMHQQYQESQFLFVTGTDMYGEIEEWKDYARLFALASFVVVHRPGFPMRKDIARFETLEPEMRISLSESAESRSVYYLPWLHQEASSTRIREAAALNQDPGQWVPREVALYIQRHRLYQTDH